MMVTLGGGAAATTGEPIATLPPIAIGCAIGTACGCAGTCTWKEKVSGYLVTKAIAAGVMLIAALFVLMGHSGEQAAVGVVPPMIGGAFLFLTGVLLIADLKQPKRFHGAQGALASRFTNDHRRSSRRRDVG